MFDDSKRLETLERTTATLKSDADGQRTVTDALGKSVGKVEGDIAKMRREFEGLVKTINEMLSRQIKADDTIREHDGAIKKLQQRCANLEAVVSKLKK